MGVAVAAVAVGLGGAPVGVTVAVRVTVAVGVAVAPVAVGDGVAVANGVGQVLPTGLTSVRNAEVLCSSFAVLKSVLASWYAFGVIGLKSVE